MRIGFNSNFAKTLNGLGMGGQVVVTQVVLTLFLEGKQIMPGCSLFLLKQILNDA